MRLRDEEKRSNDSEREKQRNKDKEKMICTGKRQSGKWKLNCNKDRQSDIEEGKIQQEAAHKEVSWQVEVSQRSW